MRELTGTDYAAFIRFFEDRYPGLRKDFPKPINWVIPGGVIQPKTVSDETYRQFRKIEFDWLLRNEFIEDSPTHPIFSTVEKGAASISTEAVTNVEAITKDTTRVFFRNNLGQIDSFDINGDLEEVNQKLGR